MLRIAGIVNESIVDGPGIRYTIFTQGCLHNCLGCHNPHTHDVQGGILMEVADIIAQIKKNPLLSGVTFSGGEPFLQAEECMKIAIEVKKMGLNVLSYTGYYYEDLVINPSFNLFLKTLDYLIDSPFIEGKIDLKIPFKGSSNQRVIDVQKSYKKGQIIEISL